MQNKIVRSIVFDAMFLAIIAVMTFVPYVGFIQIGIISFTLIHIPVLIGAALFGWKRGLIYGVFFGVVSLIKAVISPAGAMDLLFINPLISILPRAVFGLAAGFLFALVKKMPRFYQKGIHITIASFILTALHTFLVMGMIWLIYRPEIESFSAQINSQLGVALTILIAIGALIEAGIAAVVTPSVSLLVYNKYPHLASRKEQNNETRS